MSASFQPAHWAKQFIRLILRLASRFEHAPRESFEGFARMHRPVGVRVGGTSARQGPGRFDKVANEPPLVRIGLDGRHVGRCDGLSGEKHAPGRRREFRPSFDEGVNGGPSRVGPYTMPVSHGMSIRWDA